MLDDVSSIGVAVGVMAVLAVLVGMKLILAIPLGAAAGFVLAHISRLMKRKAVAYIGGPERFAPLLERLSPAFVRWLLPKVVTRD